MTKTIYAKRQQVIDQCRAVAALCDSLAELHRARESLLTAGFCDDLVEITGRRSVSIMEALADFLNNMDAVGDGDEWISEVLIAGLDMFPEKSTGAEAMTDLIQKARKEWCEQNFSMTRFSGEKYIDTNPALRPCPPEVVAALLDVVDNLIVRDVRLSQGGDEALRAIAAIERALEQKP